MLITNNEDLLRVHCDPVSADEVGELIATLETELIYQNKLGRGGIGLAAPQIGLAKDIAIIRLNDTNINLVNCQMVKSYDPTIFRQEGCLSFPGRVEDTTRFQEILIKDDLFYPNGFVATGLLAVVCQHELDHLNKTLFMDRAIPKQQPIIVKTKQKPNEPCLCGSGKKYKKCCGF